MTAYINWVVKTVSMQDRGAEIKLAVTGVIAFLTALWGWVGWLFVIFVFTEAIDFAMGYILAARKGLWSSKIAWKGIYKKFAGIMVVIAGGLFDLVLVLIADNLGHLTLPYGDITGGLLFFPLLTVWATLGELGSIVENAGGLGAHIPKFLVKSLAVFKSKIELEFDKPELIEDETDSETDV